MFPSFDEVEKSRDAALDRYLEQNVFITKIDPLIQDLVKVAFRIGYHSAIIDYADSVKSKITDG